MSRGIGSQAYRLVGFLLVPALSVLSGAVLLPLVSKQFGPAGWTALTVGQSTGAIGSVVVGLAWPFIGGFQVAVSRLPADRSSIFARSLLSRGAVLLVLAPALYLFCFVFVASDGHVAGLFALGSALNGMTAAWYWAGCGRPAPLLVSEGLVRLLGYVVAVVGIRLFEFNLSWYAICVAMSLLLGVAVNCCWVRVLEGPLKLAQALRSVRRDIRDQLPGTASRLVQGFAGFGGPLLFTLLLPQSLALFAAFDQVQKSFNNAASAVTSGFVGWVGGSPRGSRRQRFAVAFCCGGAFVFFGVFMLIGPSVFHYLFGGAVQSTAVDTALLGAVVSVIFVVRSVELLVVVPRRLEAVVYKANVWTSVLSLALMFVLGTMFGARGGEAALGVAALAAGVYYAKNLRATWVGWPEWR